MDENLNIQNKEIARLLRINSRLSRLLKEEAQRRMDVETALVEIAELVARHDEILSREGDANG